MPVEFIGEGEYKIDVIKQIKVTHSYLGMDQSVKNCQTMETIYDCKTKQYINETLKACKCLPYNLGLVKKVIELD